jgi:hypothetical protein
MPEEDLSRFLKQASKFISPLEKKVSGTKKSRR